VLELGSRLLLQSGKASFIEEAMEIQTQLISNGKAMEKFVEIVAAQGGDISVIENPENYPAPAFEAEVISNQDGFINSMEMVGVGILVNRLTIRHTHNKREIESTVGIRFLKKIGDDVCNGKPMAICFGSNKNEVISTAEELKSLINISEERIDPPPLFY
jgi:thymidine phosphorylase